MVFENKKAVSTDGFLLKIGQTLIGISIVLGAASCGGGGGGNSAANNLNNQSLVDTDTQNSEFNQDDTQADNIESDHTHIEHRSRTIDYREGFFTLDSLPDGDFKTRALQLPILVQQVLIEELQSLELTAKAYEHLHVMHDGKLVFFDQVSFLLGDAEQSTANSPDSSKALSQQSSSGGHDGHSHAAKTATKTATNYQQADVFNLSSKPGANRTIFLDFDGHVIEFTEWNNPANFSFFWIPQPRYDALPYSTDDDYDNFSQQELAEIVEIWQQIAEDFSAFNVNVTTREPNSFNRHTGRVLFTDNRDANDLKMPNRGPFAIAGIAFYDVFGDSDYHTRRSPAFVYSNVIRGSSGNSSYTAHNGFAGSHEMGHNLGLLHHGRKNADEEYYAGHGSGNVSWAPIMGNGKRQVTQWSNGEYADANKSQDDLRIIQNELGLKTDDHTDGLDGAMRLSTEGDVIRTVPLENNIQNAERPNFGQINLNSDRSPDVDVFEFDMGSGQLDIKISPNWQGIAAQANNDQLRSANLHVYAELWNADGNVIASATENNDTFAHLTNTLPSGRYYLAISGGSSLNYSAYASQGQYYIHGTRPEAVADLSVNITLLNDNRLADDTYTLAYHVNNDGPDFAGDVDIQLLPQADATQITFETNAMDSFSTVDQQWSVHQLCSGCQSELLITYRTANKLQSDSYALEIVSSTSADSDSSPNNQALQEDDYAAYTLPASAQADVSVDIATISDSRQQNGRYRIEYRISNDGPDAALDTELRFVGNERVSQQSVSAQSGQVSNDRWSIPLLNSGSTASLVVEYFEAMPTKLNLPHSLEVISSNTFDPDSQPNNGLHIHEDDVAYHELDSTIPKVIDLQLTSQMVTEIVGGQVVINIEYTLVNRGDFAAKAIRAELTRHADLVIASVHTSANSNTNLFGRKVMYWNIPELSPNETATYSFTGTQPPIFVPHDPLGRYTIYSYARMSVFEAFEEDGDSVPNENSHLNDASIYNTWSTWPGRQ